MSTNKFTISFVTINRNNADNLHRTLVSLQKLKNFTEIECIFIDGASIDKSVDIAKAFYKSENLISEHDSGIYEAMNKGLYKASGKYIIWLNSGDELDQDLDIKYLLNELRSSKMDLLCGKTIMCKAESGYPFDVFTPDISRLPSHTLPHPSSFFRRSCLLEMGGYDEALKIVGDRDLIIRMFLSRKVIGILDITIAKFYEGGISYSRAAMFENWRIDRKNGLISIFEFYIKIFKFEIGKFRRLIFKGNLLR